jgi:hypothetical protein
MLEGLSCDVSSSFPYAWEVEMIVPSRSRTLRSLMTVSANVSARSDSRERIID